VVSIRGSILPANAEWVDHRSYFNDRHSHSMKTLSIQLPRPSGEMRPSPCCHTRSTGSATVFASAYTPFLTSDTTAMRGDGNGAEDDDQQDH
jgi:hypothetical protein